MEPGWVQAGLPPFTYQTSAEGPAGTQPARAGVVPMPREEARAEMRPCPNTTGRVRAGVLDLRAALMCDVPERPLSPWLRRCLLRCGVGRAPKAESPAVLLGPERSGSTRKAPYGPLNMGDLS